jgi:hypothetical protein
MLSDKADQARGGSSRTPNSSTSALLRSLSRQHISRDETSLLLRSRDPTVELNAVHEQPLEVLVNGFQLAHYPPVLWIVEKHVFACRIRRTQKVSCILTAVVSLYAAVSNFISARAEALNFVQEVQYFSRIKINWCGSVLR